MGHGNSVSFSDFHSKHLRVKYVKVRRLALVLSNVAFESAYPENPSPAYPNQGVV
jgi:hypothetical protein